MLKPRLFSIVALAFGAAATYYLWYASTPFNPGTNLHSYAKTFQMCLCIMGGLIAVSGLGGVVVSFGLQLDNSSQLVARDNLIGRSLFTVKYSDNFCAISMRAGVTLCAFAFIFSFACLFLWVAAVGYQRSLSTDHENTLWYTQMFLSGLFVATVAGLIIVRLHKHFCSDQILKGVTVLAVASIMAVTVYQFLQDPEVYAKTVSFFYDLLYVIVSLLVIAASAAFFWVGVVLVKKLGRPLGFCPVAPPEKQKIPTPATQPTSS